MFASYKAQYFWVYSIKDFYIFMRRTAESFIRVLQITTALLTFLLLVVLMYFYKGISLSQPAERVPSYLIPIIK
jgi:hypothetical protein